MRQLPQPDQNVKRGRRRGLGWLGKVLLTLGAFLPLGQANAAPVAETPSEQPVIERVEEIRSKLLAIEGGAHRQQQYDQFAQWYNWPNWPNWNNWYNWPNWGDWCNWCGHVPRRAGRWRWPGR
jgi:hypothetical protein